MATINDSLNLVLPVRSDETGVRLYAFHTPISREVFEANYRLLAATKSSLLAKGVHYMMDAGPRIAALALRDEGKRDAADQGENGDGGASALLGEFKRLTVVLSPGPAGWEMLPVDAALAQGVLDAEEWAETESAVSFFTCHFALARKAERSRIASATASVLKGSITSSSATAFGTSLLTSTTSEATEGKAGSSVPS